MIRTRDGGDVVMGTLNTCTSTGLFISKRGGGRFYVADNGSLALGRLSRAHIVRMRHSAPGTACSYQSNTWFSVWCIVDVKTTTDRPIRSRPIQYHGGT